MVSKITKWMLIAFSICCLTILLGGCGEPEQTTKPGEFGHYIYAKDPDNIVEWRVKGMYINDSLMVMGNLRYVDYKYPIMNIKTGETIGYYEIKSSK